MICSNLSEKRNSLLPKHLIERPNIIKFNNLMTSKRKPILQKLRKFIRYIIQQIKIYNVFCIGKTDLLFFI
jgi:hypothetical protein